MTDPIEFLRAGGSFDPYTWSLLPAEDRKVLADYAEQLRERQAVETARQIVLMLSDEIKGHAEDGSAEAASILSRAVAKEGA